MPLILRLEKGSPLTYQEMDANLTYLFSASINDTGSEIFSGSLTVTGSLKVTGSTAMNGTWILTGSAVTSGSLKVLGNINNSGSIYITTDTLATFVPSIVITSSVDGFNILELYNNANQGYSATALTLKNNLLDKSHIIVPGEYYGYGWFDNDSITGSLVLHSNKDVVFIASGSTFPKSGEETLRIQRNRVIISGSLIVTGTTTVLSSSIITGSLTVTGSENVIGNAFITGSLNLTGSFIQTGSVFLTGSMSASTIFSTGRITGQTFRPTGFNAGFITDHAGVGIIGNQGLTGNGDLQLASNSATRGITFYVNGTAGTVIATLNSTTSTISSSLIVSSSIGLIITGSLSVNPSGSFTLPTTASFIAPTTGSMFFSASLLYIYDGTRYRSASLA